MSHYRMVLMDTLYEYNSSAFGGISGGISGELLKRKSNEMLRKVRNLVGDDATLIASGGVSSKDVEERVVMEHP